MQLLRRRAYARAGLVGNPSDGYNGKTISISVRNYWADVVLYEEAGRRWGVGRSDPSGLLALALPSGRYRLRTSG